MEKWQACPVCCGTGYTTDTFLSCIKEKCDVCESEKIIHTETGLPPGRHREFVVSGKDVFQGQDNDLRVWTGTGWGLTGTTCGERHDVTIENPNIPHTLTNINDRIPRMENPPPPPPVKRKNPSHIL